MAGESSRREKILRDSCAKSSERNLTSLSFFASLACFCGYQLLLPAAAGVASCCEALDADDLAGEVDQDRTEGGTPLEVREVPTGGGGSPAKAVRSNPGAHRAIARSCGWVDGLGMTRRTAHNGSRRNTSGGCHAPITKNGAEKPLWHARRGPFQAVRPEKARKQGRRTRGGTVQWTNTARRCSRAESSGKCRLNGHHAARPMRAAGRMLSNTLTSAETRSRQKDRHTSERHTCASFGTTSP